ncbi:uncharacterized protein G2W53_026961 [Senna tora]|uniref:Uncharacterized protein n=1 Tax=Senna tora TaxID=362788 RepID=A0A834TI01_9FABA|nr:uncharacterized protein G2W53_026961 [Senna tora]
MVNLFLGRLGNTIISNELHFVFLSKHVTCLLEFLKVLNSFLLNFLLVCGPLSIRFCPSLLDNLLKLWVVKPHCFKLEMLPLMCIGVSSFTLSRSVLVDCLAFLFKSSVWSSTSSSTRVFLFLGFGALRKMVSDTGPCFPFFLTNSSITSNSCSLFRFLSFRCSSLLGLPSDALFYIVSSVLMMVSIGGVAISSWTTSVASWSTCIFRWSADDRLGRSTLYKVQSRGKDCESSPRHALLHIFLISFHTSSISASVGLCWKGLSSSKIGTVFPERGHPVARPNSPGANSTQLRSFEAPSPGVLCSFIRILGRGEFKLWLGIHHMIRQRWEPNQSHELHPSTIQSSEPSEGFGTPKATLYRPGAFIKNLLPIFFNIEMDDIVPTYSSNYSRCSSEVPEVVNNALFQENNMSMCRSWFWLRKPVLVGLVLRCFLHIFPNIRVTRVIPAHLPGTNRGLGESQTSHGLTSESSRTATTRGVEREEKRGSNDFELANPRGGKRKKEILILR